MRRECESNLGFEASQWVEQLKQQPDDATRRKFAEWMGRSPDHMEEYLAMLELDELLAAIDPGRTCTVEDLCGKR